MGTIQLGSRLVRSLGEGDRMRTFVTETLGQGKTLTKVLDKNGTVISERLKVIAPKEQVGDKFVRRITKVTDSGKKIIDDVYNASGKKIGNRTQYFDRPYALKPDCVRKNYKNRKTYTYYDDNGLRIEKAARCPSGEYQHLFYNDLGLPIPYGEVPLDIYECGYERILLRYDGMSLKGIRELFQTEHPNLSFAPKEFGLQKLDESVVGSKLEQYI